VTGSGAAKVAGGRGDGPLPARRAYPGELTERAGMTQPGIARFEAGGTTPTLPLLERWPPLSASP
jgi:hypothetical protein